MTGRVEELMQISGLTRRRDGPAGVVLAGAAGVGKTRLAREALAAAEQCGALTNRQIAQRLVISVRTVENHLYRAGTKLGTSDRAELATLLHDHH